VDNAKGTVVYHAEVPANHGTCDVKAMLVENWLVYHYYESEFVERGNVKGTKGYRIVTVELYEGKGVDDKIQRCVCLRQASSRLAGRRALQPLWVHTN
jgi:hypothetical protein